MARSETSRPVAEGKAPLWLVNWSDSEQADFLWACDTAGVRARVLRGAELAHKAGRPLHSLRCLRAQAWVVLRGLREADGAPLITWQPAMGALLGLLAPRRRSRLVVLNPLLDLTRTNLRQRIMLYGLARADRVLFFSVATLNDGVSSGLQARRLRFVPLGARTTGPWSPPTADYFLAIGREERDWTTLAKAAEGLSSEVWVIGPTELSEPGPLKLLPQVERPRLLELMKDARAIVVPLKPTARPAGQLTVVDGISVGRAVVATQAPGVEDYISSETGMLVPPGDVLALRDALVRLSDPALAERMGMAAFEAARRRFSLERFVTEVDAEARPS